ncbi:MAG: hypothetical protein JW839_11625 [Candidatus Lokiarchaeota archaeon]|nr:hypothetical protein [Candidatus Lokiarchaeota archaeon]
MPGLEGDLGKNINGPCLMRVPAWVERPLGRYYLYFGHHKGKYIRLAFSDRVEGPYTIHSPGVLPVEKTPGKKRHVASPEIFIDEANQEIRMYFHAVGRGKKPYRDQTQMTYVATSRDGLNFTPRKQQLAPFYLRVFKHGGYFYGFAKDDNAGGMIVRSRDGLSAFERGPAIVPGFRHCALLPKGLRLLVFFTRVGDAPERILLSAVDITGDWRQWVFSEPTTVLEPAFPWEGVDLPLAPSRHGPTGPSNALRDPEVFVEGGVTYLFYCVKGEQGIALAKLVPGK